MSNVTLSIDEDLLKAGREYARQHNMSLNELIRRLLADTVRPGSADWLEETFRLADQAGLKPIGRRWRRDELYDV